ncbi:hypothetical protein ACEZCY_14685 [Streptacidiphilus sp. N1-12]|uniref:Uncharacterized protein n=2 Tax=Streptacidiphilus alkalitolerans TaxID=3342712 RepID=A0ABV6V9V4_9ACTN
MKLPRLPRPARAARTASDLVDLLGLGCLDAAAWWLYPVAGLVVLGLVLLLIGWVMDR